MTTPWERITDDSYKSWLLDTPISVDEFNAASLVERRTLRSQFQQEQQQPQPVAQMIQQQSVQQQVPQKRPRQQQVSKPSTFSPMKNHGNNNDTATTTTNNNKRQKKKQMTEQQQKQKQHELLTIPPYHRFDKRGALVPCRGQYSQRQCSECQKRTRNYCCCRPGTMLCPDCFANHVVQVMSSSNMMHEYETSKDNDDKRSTSTSKHDVMVHELLTIPKFHTFRGDQLLPCKAEYAQRLCTGAKCRKKVRTYCRCRPGIYFCFQCFANHKVEEYMMITTRQEEEEEHHDDDDGNNKDGDAAETTTTCQASASTMSAL